MNTAKHISRRKHLVKNIKSIVKPVIPTGIKSHIIDMMGKDNRKRIYFNNNLVVVNKDDSIEGAIPIFYWDSEPNFGDVIGPFLVSKITNTPVVNCIHTKSPCLMTVGSILNLVNRKNMMVWGSGLIHEPSNRELKKLAKFNPHILSVRGHKTAEVLNRIGIDISNKNAYGDPALLMPIFYQVKSKESNKISICPHFLHKAKFLKSITLSNQLNIIDVQADMYKVVDEIASSSVCISTSLHGLIIAQAYGVPWIWLEITDNNLRGNDFKFKDFFSTIDESMVAHVQIELNDIVNINFEELASKATLPEKLYNEELILASLTQNLSKIQKKTLSYLPIIK